MERRLKPSELFAAIVCWIGVLRLVLLMPFVLPVWGDIYNLDEAQMGLLASVELGVTSTVAYVMGWLLRYTRPMPAFSVSFIVFAVVDYLSFGLTNLEGLMLLRAVSGVFTGIMAAVIAVQVARAKHPGQAYGFLNFGVFIIPAVAIYLIPDLIALFGSMVLRNLLLVFLGFGVVMLPWISRAPLDEVPAAATGERGRQKVSLFIPLLSLAMVFVCQTVVGGYWPFAESIANARGLTLKDAALALAIASFIAAFFSLVIYQLEQLAGRSGSIFICLAAMIGGFGSMLLYEGYVPYLIAAISVAIAWGVIPSMIFDIIVSSTDRPAIVAIYPGVQGYGMALGPLIVGGLLSEGLMARTLQTLIALLLVHALLLVVFVKKGAVYAGRSSSRP